MAAFLCLIIATISITGNVIQASQVKTVPYIIEVDKLGKASVVARADSVTSTPQRLIQAEITKSGKLVHVEIKDLPLLVSSDFYWVEWQETVRSHAGVLLDSHTYEATVTIQINPLTVDANAPVKPQQNKE